MEAPRRAVTTGTEVKARRRSFVEEMVTDHVQSIRRRTPSRDVSLTREISIFDLQESDGENLSESFLDALKNIPSGQSEEEFLDGYMEAHWPVDSSRLPFVRPFLLSLAKDLRLMIKMANWGLFLRLFLGVLLTYGKFNGHTVQSFHVPTDVFVGDVVTDVLVIKEFAANDSEFFVPAAVFFVFPFLAQVFSSILFGQPWSDACLSLLGLKTIIDSWRTWRGVEAPPGQYSKFIITDLHVHYF